LHFPEYLIRKEGKGERLIKIRLMLIMGYLGAVIGAGFASGQEIVQFFVSYGNYGLKGSILATFLFAICGALLLYTAHRCQVANYQGILAYLLGKKSGQYVDFILAIFLFLGISTMLSASGAVFYEHLYLPKSLGIMLAYITVVIMLLTGKKGLILAYNILVPLKLLLLLGITIYVAFVLDDIQLPSYALQLCPSNERYWAVSSLLYVAYNFSLAMVVLSEYQTLSNVRTGIAGAAWGGIVLGSLVILTFLTLRKFLPVVLHYEVPMLFVAGQLSLTAKHVYTIVLWIGILTTAIANAYGFAQRFASFTGISYGPCLILCMTLALPVSMQSFSALVGKVYPLFGVLGIIIMAALFWKSGQDIGRHLYYNIIQLVKKAREV